MFRIALLILLGAVAYAQTAQTPKPQTPKPPAKTDKALRARADEFYQDHVKGEVRKAEPLVADDTKDYFFTIAKPQYLSCEVKTVDYSEKFTRAKVMTLCEQYINMMGFAGTPVKLPVISTWKLEKGKWYWYVDRNAPVTTPFGVITRKSDTAPGASPFGRMPASIPSTADFLNKISADKTSLTLKPGESGEVTFSNSALGGMSVSVYGNPAGYEVTPARAALKRDGKATVTIKALDEAKSETVNFRVDQTGEMIAVKIEIN